MKILIMDSAIDRKFRELTEGRSREDAFVSVFAYIRDIPYYADPRHFSLQKGPEGILSSGRGACFPKHYLLGKMITGLGFEVDYRVYSFFWKDQGFPVPENLRTLAEGLPATYHMACKVCLGDEGSLVDATWDKPLENAGFPVNDPRRCRNGMALGVSFTMEAFTARRAEEADGYVSSRLASYSAAQKIRLGRFTRGFNEWIKEARHKYKEA